MAALGQSCKVVLARWCCWSPPPLLCHSLPFQAVSSPHAQTFAALPDLTESQAAARPPAAYSTVTLIWTHGLGNAPFLAYRSHHSAPGPHAPPAANLGTPRAGDQAPVCLALPLFSCIHCHCILKQSMPQESRYQWTFKSNVGHFGKINKLKQQHNLNGTILRCLQK